jgi:hypothetical protein
MKVMVPAPVRAPRRKQTAAERAAVYRYVEARDVSCRAWDIACMLAPGGDFIGNCGDQLGHQPPGPPERHHAGNTIGSKRITDARHVVLLCEWHHRTWAPTHSRLILEWLARVEDAREAT